MARPWIVITLLSVTLLASNLWWAAMVFDGGITNTYMSVSLEDSQIALDQTLAILKEVASPDATRQSVIDAAAGAAGHPYTFEKHGLVWTGRVGLKFDENDQLIEVLREWDSP